MARPISDFGEQLQSLLCDLDDLQAGEEAEDLNATLEDVIMLLEETDPDDPDAAEAMTDALAELNDLREAYARVPGMSPYAERLAAIIAGRG